MGYLKAIAGKYIASLHIVDGEGNIEKDEFDALEVIFNERPEAPGNYQYLLRADNLTWEMVKMLPDDDLDDSEALAIILGGGDA